MKYIIYPTRRLTTYSSRKILFAYMPRIAAKATDESKEASREKLALEKRRFRAVLSAFVKKEEIAVQELFYPENSDVLGQNLYAIVLEYINVLKTVDKNYDTYPASTFNLSNSKPTKKSIEDCDLPKKKPVKKTDTAKDSRSTEDIVREELNAMHEAELAKKSKRDDEKNVPDASDTRVGKAKQTKKTITAVSKTGKLMLAFIAERFVQEVVHIDCDDDVNNTAAFEKYLSAGVTADKSLPSRITPTILHAVQAYKPIIDNLSASNLNLAEERIADILRSQKVFAVESDDDTSVDRSYLAKHVSQMLCKYFKVLGCILATTLWVSQKNINAKLIEHAIRISDTHNASSLHNGFYKGLFRSYYTFEQNLYPPAPKAEKKPRSEKAAKADAKADVKPAKAAKKSKAADVSDEPAKPEKRVDVKKIKAVEKPAVRYEQDDMEPESISDDDT